MIDRTPEQWRDILLVQLASRRSGHDRLRNYYSGAQPLPTAPSTATDTYRRLAELGVTNMCGLVVDTVNERLRPVGVRLSADADADLVIWREIWQANNLDADWSIAQEEALKIGRCPVLVWPDDENPDHINVTVEDADEVIVAYAPGTRRRRVAAMKTYSDGEIEYATVWLPSFVQSWWRYQKSSPKSPVLSSDGSTIRMLHVPKTYTVRNLWEDDPTLTGTNPLGRIPVVELLSKPSVKGVPAPELSTAVLHLQNRINKTMFDAVVSSEFGSFPLRYTIGIELQRNPDGTPINPLVIGPNRVAALVAQDGQTGTIGQLEPFPLADLLNLADASIKHLASISQTPVYYLLSGLSNVGADSIRAAETGHVAKIINHQTIFGEAAGEIFRLALLARGMGSPPPDIALQWAAPETRSPAELADAAIKLAQAGYPFMAIARYMGETPSEIERLVKERAATTVPVEEPAFT